MFICISLLLIAWSIFHHPTRHGDGWEYIGMTVSLGNHLSPNLTESDISELKDMQEKNDLNTNPYIGYFKDLKGKWYSYHFWFYSLLSIIAYWILKLFGSTNFSFLQFTNSCIMIFGIWYTLYKFSGTERIKYWALIFFLFNPIWLYLPWTHPELLTFVFVYVGLLAYVENKPVLGIILTAFASFQNPAVAVLTAFIGLNELIKERKFSVRIIFIELSCLVVLFPYIWFWIHFHKFSLLAEIATGKMNLMKSVSLLTDLNFGAIIFIPVLFLTVIYLVLKRKWKAILWSSIIIIICLICSTQINWNSDMAYINRYTIWLLPLFMMAVLEMIVTMRKKYFIIYSVVFALTTGSITLYAIFNPINHLEFSPLAKWAIKKVPSLYYPQYEVFLERASGREFNNPKEQLPIEYIDEYGVRKKLYFENGEYRYFNGNMNFAKAEYLGLMLSYKSGDDIFGADTKALFSTGWYGLDGKSRWTAQESNLLLFSDEEKQKTISMNIANYQIPRNCKIFINDKLVYSGLIDKPSVITFQVLLKQRYNKVFIQSIESAVSPTSINSTFADSRKLAFFISKFTVLDQVIK